MTKSRTKKILTIIIVVLVCLVIVAGGISIWLWEWAKDVYFINKDMNVKYQQEHLTYLREEFYTNYVSSGEQRLCDFNLEEALNSGVKYNEMAFLATHNSYQRLSTETTRKDTKNSIKTTSKTIR